MGKLDPADYEGAIGICLTCKEYTEVLEPCCGGNVSFEGGVYCAEDFEELVVK